MYEIPIRLPFNGYHIDGKLSLPVKAESLIIFSHGYGQSTLIPHEHELAFKFQQEGFGTLVFDTLDSHELIPKYSKELNILSKGLLTSTNWLHNHSEYKSLDLAYFGSGTGAAVALEASTKLSSVVKAIVSLGGRLDLLKTKLQKVTCPTLLLVGELDFQIVNTNKYALEHLKGEKQLAVIPGASRHLEEPGKLNQAGNIAVSWFKKYLKSAKRTKAVS